MTNKPYSDFYLTDREKRRLAVYNEIINLYNRIVTEFPDCPAPIALCVRTINNSKDYANFRAQYPEYPNTGQGIRNIIYGKTKLQAKVTDFIEKQKTAIE